MNSYISLKKGTYEAAKLSSIKSQLPNSEAISSLSILTYEEILKYLEEHGFKEVIDNSYLSYEGFYLIEKILNDYLSGLYSKFFKATSKNNQKFLENYYLKYQIHNFMATLRCKISSTQDLNPYLIGDEHRKEKYLKASTMSTNDALEYLSKKLSFDSQKVHLYYQKGLFELENYLYAQYYNRLFENLPMYSKVEDKKYISFLKTYIDLLNLRTKLVIEDQQESLFDELFISRGNISVTKFNNSSQDLFKLVNSELDLSLKKPVDVDLAIINHKNAAATKFSKVSFGSPYAILGFFFTVENSIGQVRKLLKAKYMGLSDSELDEVLKYE